MWFLTATGQFLSLSFSVPSNVGSVSVFDRKETYIILQWEKVNNSLNYTYELQYWIKGEPPTLISPTDSLEEHNVTSLSPGTEYFFTLYTVFEGVWSSGYNFSNVTGESHLVCRKDQSLCDKQNNCFWHFSQILN